MAATKEMQTINAVLLGTQGSTGEMLSNGLHHAFQVAPEERHELQVQLVSMAAEVLGTAHSSALFEVEEGCQRKLADAEAKQKTQKAEVVNAMTALESTQVNAAAQKKKLEEAQEQVALQEEEHRQSEVANQEKAKELAACEQAKSEVVGLLQAVELLGTEDVIMDYLREADAEPALLSALPSVLKKAPSERCDFDDVALAHLRCFLQQKIGSWTDAIEALVSAKASFHAEALGAWAVKEVAADRVQEATKELQAADKGVEDARQVLTGAQQAEQRAELSLAQANSDFAAAGEKLRQCSAAVEALAKLEAGPKEVAMDVDQEAACQINVAMPGMEMGTAITA